MAKEPPGNDEWKWMAGKLRYPIPSDALAKARDGKVPVKFVAQQMVAAGVFEVRLLRAN